MRNLLELTASMALCLLVGVISGLSTAASIKTWYQELAKPAWTPPNWVFGPVWTLLYIGMGIAVWLVWRERGTRDVTAALTCFLIQLALNFLWSPVFFGMHKPGWALADVLALWIAIAVTIALFYRVSVPASVLLIPYFLWVSYASALNYAIWRLNR